MNNLNQLLGEMKSRCEKATEGPWEAVGNIPFYVDMKKPAPSLSKHDEKRPTYWRVEDALFVLHARTDVPRLIAALEKAIEHRNQLLQLIPNDEENVHEGTFEQCNAELCKILGGTDEL